MCGHEDSPGNKSGVIWVLLKITKFERRPYMDHEEKLRSSLYNPNILVVSIFFSIIPIFPSIFPIIPV